MGFLLGVIMGLVGFLLVVLKGCVLGADFVKHGVVTPHEDVLSLVNEMAQTLAVVDTKLDLYVRRDEERKEEVERLRGELSDLKVRVYSVAAVLSVVVSVGVSWLSGRLGL